MIREPFIAHSELTNEIYIVSGREKYRVTEQAIKAVDAIKALKQEPRKGHWLHRPHVYGVTYCSICDFELKIDNTNYCPNCGAKMESEDKE